jgi:hypothetical protein
MNMNLVTNLRRVGTLLFALMWVPFAGIFIGMAREYGDAGVRFAEFVEGFVPGLMTARDDLSMFSAISMALTFGMMFVAMAFLFGAPMLGMLRSRKILQNGKQATARILSVGDTGTYINRQPLVHITMEVERPDGSPFQAETERVLGYSQLARFQAGESISVRYDPDTLETAIAE